MIVLAKAGEKGYIASLAINMWKEHTLKELKEEFENHKIMSDYCSP